MMTRFRDLIGGVFFLAFSIFLYVTSYQIRLTKADPIGPQFFPRMVALLMGTLALISIVRSLLRLREQAGTAGSAPKKPFAAVAFLGTCVLLVAYMLLIDKVGFIPLSIVYLYLQILLVSPPEELAKKNLLINGVVAVLVPVTLYYLFYHAFGIFLPAGILE